MLYIVKETISEYNYCNALDIAWEELDPKKTRRWTRAASLKNITKILPQSQRRNAYKLLIYFFFFFYWAVSSYADMPRPYTGVRDLIRYHVAE